MAMDAAMIERLIKESLPDAQVSIEDLRGDGDHYAAHVVSGAFRGKSRVQQHQMVYQAIARPDGRRAARAGLADRRARGLISHEPSTKALRPRPHSQHIEDRQMDDTVQDRIRQHITETPVVLFMKGTPVFPQCGFSAAVVQILSHIGVKFKGIDVLSDPEIRQGIKEFSSWPTIPQLYVKGEFVGGCDIIREMFETGELQQLFEEKGVPVRA